MLKLAVAIGLAEILGLIGFIVASSRLGQSLFRYSPFLVMLIIVCVIAYYKTRHLTAKQIFISSIASALIFSVLYDIIGFSIFPGIVKDIVFFSLKNVSGLMQMTLICGTFNFITLNIFKAISLFTSSRSSH
jgi:hypothetical protein